MNESKALMVPCPTCGVGKYRACLRPSGRRLPQPHRNRVDLYMRAELKARG